VVKLIVLHSAVYPAGMVTVTPALLVTVSPATGTDAPPQVAVLFQSPDTLAARDAAFAKSAPTPNAASKTAKVQALLAKANRSVFHRDRFMVSSLPIFRRNKMPHHKSTSSNYIHY
jgi:hypothetical protein